MSEHARRMSAVAPFPWKLLEEIPRSSVAALRDARRWADRYLRLETFASALAELVGADIRVLVRRAAPRTGGPALSGAVAVLVAGEGGAIGAALLEVEVALAASLVSRAIRRPAPAIVVSSSQRSGTLAGGFAAVAMAAARRAHTGSMLRVLSAGTAEAVESAFVGDGREMVALSLTVLVADEAYAARLVVARDESFAASPAEWSARRLASLGAAPLSLPIVACAAVTTLGDLAALREGDVWMPGTWRLDRSANGLRGPVLLAAPGSATGLRAQLVENDRLVLSGDVDAVCAGEGDMTEAEGKDALLDAVGDVPVVVRVEIGEARMAAREWAALGRGDVVTLGRRVGELVLLRVGGVPFARGELVNVEGEIGVRIAERIAGEASGAPTER